jgi:hypothetical protein
VHDPLLPYSPRESEELYEQGGGSGTDSDDGDMDSDSSSNTNEDSDEQPGLPSTIRRRIKKQTQKMKKKRKEEYPSYSLYRGE